MNLTVQADNRNGMFVPIRLPSCRKLIISKTCHLQHLPLIIQTRVSFIVLGHGIELYNQLDIGKKNL